MMNGAAWGLSSFQYACTETLTVCVAWRIISFLLAYELLKSIISNDLKKCTYNAVIWGEYKLQIKVYLAMKLKQRNTTVEMPKSDQLGPEN